MQEVSSAVIITEDSQVFDLVKSYLSDFGFCENNVIREDFNCSIDKFENGTYFIVDITKNENYDFILSLSSVKNSKIIVISDEINIDKIMKSLRAGAKEFLAMPIIKNELEASLKRLENTEEYKNQSTCQVISIFSNKGGIGKTTIATNLALQLANTTKEKVALLDLNFQTGDITTFLNINPSFDITYLLQNLDKMSYEFIFATLENYKNSSLFILANPPFLKQYDDIKGEQITKIINILKKHFSYIVIDADTSFDSRNVSALTLSDFTFLVTVANMPALRNTQRCLNLFEKFGFNNPYILLNRYMENDDVSVNDVEKVLAKKVFWKIPNNYFTIMSAINKGIPVSELNPDSNVAKSYRDLALYLFDKIYEENLINKYDNILGGNFGFKR